MFHLNKCQHDNCNEFAAHVAPFQSHFHLPLAPPLSLSLQAIYGNVFIKPCKNFVHIQSHLWIVYCEKFSSLETAILNAMERINYAFELSLLFSIIELSFIIQKFFN